MKLKTHSTFKQRNVNSKVKVVVVRIFIKNMRTNQPNLDNQNKYV